MSRELVGKLLLETAADELALLVGQKISILTSLFNCFDFLALAATPPPMKIEPVSWGTFTGRQGGGARSRSAVMRVTCSDHVVIKLSPQHVIACDNM